MVTSQYTQRDLSFREFLFEPFGFVMGDESVDERSELAVHDVGELVQREADAVIGYAVLRKIVSANFFRAVAGLDLTAAFGA